MKKITKKITKKIQQLFFNNLPLPIKSNFIRTSINLPQSLANNMSFKIADTSKELEEAYSVLHDAYVEQTFITPQENGMRIVSQYVLPTTTTIVGKIDDQVVGTLSIIKAGELGLPMEKVFDISKFKNGSNTYAEISALAIKKGFRREFGGSIFFPLLKYMHNYCLDFFNVEYILITIHPKDKDFYKELLFFEDIPNTGTIDYMGTPAIALALNLKTVGAKFKEHFENKPAMKNMYTFFIEKTFPQFTYPKREYSITNDSIINEELFKEFFVAKGNIFKNISLSEFMQLKDFFSNTSIASVFTEYLDRQRLIRLHHRYSVKMIGTIKNTEHEFVIADVSKKGLKIKSFTPFKADLIYNLEISINNSNTVDLQVYLTRKSNNTYAFQILNENPKWINFIKDLENLHFNQRAN
ncbi:MAG: hypothetical protein Q7U04_07430 [Bacteriovorax sp.]|nr:hypothetical protein [Bacteriovorax sp.]